MTDATPKVESRAPQGQFRVILKSWDYSSNAYNFIFVKDCHSLKEALGVAQEESQARQGSHWAAAYDSFEFLIYDDNGNLRKA
jgi:hypothetical protein